MNNTEQSFKDKWEKNRGLALEETLREGSEIFNWILSRNGFKSSAEFSKFLSSKRRILDAGCGNGRVTALMRKYSHPDTHLVGIDLVASDIARDNMKNEARVSFYKKDLLESLADIGKFDFIYCQEVLHHTSDPQGAFNNLVSRLEPGGEIAIYVYKKKAPAREFLDDYIRNQISKLPYAEALEHCNQITNMGKALADLKLEIKVPEVKVLEIPAGTYDLQRFIYHFFFKCFWNDGFSAEENSVINYDWYHPENCSRHTLEEVRSWFEMAGLNVTYEFVDFYGITLRACSPMKHV